MDYYVIFTGNFIRYVCLSQEAADKTLPELKAAHYQINSTYHPSFEAYERLWDWRIAVVPGDAR